MSATTPARVRCDAIYPAWSPDASHMIVPQYIWNTADFDLVNVELRNR